MLVGRDRELATLSEVLGRGRSAIVVGEAGVGKTALIETCLRASELGALRGGGLATLSWMAYLPISRAIAEEIPATADTPGVAALVVDRAGEQILVIDDLHWADAQTLALLEHLDQASLIAAVRRGDPGADAALVAADRARMEAIELAPLEPGAAAALVRQANPRLSDEDVDAVVASAHGNPLLLEQVALAEGDAPAALRLTLGARLNPLGPQEREILARLALLGRAASAAELEGDVGGLLEAGLVYETPDGFMLHHALIGDAARELLDDQQVRALHARLARVVESRGEAARHHFAAGETELAHRAALEAAEQTERAGERAVHLGLAARSAAAGDVAALRVRAAGELTAAGDFEAAIELLEEIELQQPAMRAQAELHLGSARAALEGFAAAEPHFAAGLELVPDDEAELEVRLLIGRAHSRLYGVWGAPEAVSAAHAAWERAQIAGVRQAEALYVLGMAGYLAGTGEYREHLARALREARAAGDIELELKIGSLQAAAMEADGDAAGAYELELDLIAKADQHWLRGVEALMLGHVAYLDVFHRGDYEAALALFERLLAKPATLGLGLPAARAFYSLALADTGRFAEARTAQALALEVDSPSDKLLALWAAAECEWLEGHLERAAELAEQALAVDPHGLNRTMAVLTLNRTAVESGRPPPGVMDPVPYRSGAAAAPENRGLLEVAQGAHGEAHRSFLEAARLWHKNELRAELRCLWSAGEAAIDAGMPEAAREPLLEAEKRAEEHGLVPLLGRVRRSLRRAGIHRSAPRTSGDGPLTAREREVIGLVGEGLTSREIATRLGVARSTVESQVRSVMAKLGAASRREAAVLARRDQPRN